MPPKNMAVRKQIMLDMLTNPLFKEAINWYKALRVLRDPDDYQHARWMYEKYNLNDVGE